MKLTTAIIVLATTVCTAAISTLTKDLFYKNGYQEGYEQSTSYFKQLLLDENFAEYDKKTAEWRLLDASTIQGNLIPITKKSLYVSIDDQIQSYEDELKMLKKQKEASSKKKPLSKTAKLDVKKLF